MAWLNLYQNLKQAIQDVIAPEMQQLRGDIKALSAKIDAVHQELTLTQAFTNRQFDAMDRRFSDMDKRFDEVDKRFNALKDDIDRRFDAVDKRLDGVDKRIDGLAGVFHWTCMSDWRR